MDPLLSDHVQSKLALTLFLNDQFHLVKLEYFGVLPILLQDNAITFVAYKSEQPTPNRATFCRLRLAQLLFVVDV